MVASHGEELPFGSQAQDSVIYEVQGEKRWICSNLCE